MPELLEAVDTCTHCGDVVGSSPIVSEYGRFCCSGCEAVHELLSGTSLDTHFQTTSQQNQSLSYIQAEKKYQFLDHPAIADKVLAFKEGQQAMVRFHLSGIHCSSCIFLLEHLPKLNPSIFRSEVQFIKKNITLTFNPEEISLKRIAILLAQLGYPPDITLDQIGKSEQKPTSNPFRSQIAVAGFCFGNAMLMSFPEYLDIELEMDASFRSLFRWINLFLAIPVVFFSGWDYLKKATNGLLNNRLTIDLPIALGLITLFGRSAFEIITHTGPGYVDSLAGLVFFLLIGKWYQNKTYQALSFERDYASYFPVSVIRMRNGSEVPTPLDELKVGDEIVLHNDEILPADAILISRVASMDYSFVTGESRPVEKKQGEDLFAGGRLKGIQIQCRLTQRVSTSQLTQLWNQQVFRKEARPLQTAIDRISRYFTASVLLLALANAIYWQVTEPNMVWLSTTAILIVACPCALALSLPFAHGHALRVLGKKGFFLKNADVVERLAHSKELIFDKTGTITSNEERDIHFIGNSLTDDQWAILSSALENSAHPLSRAVLSLAPNPDRLPLQSFSEIPGKGFEASVQDIQVRVGSREWVEGNESATPPTESRVYISFDGSCLGYFRCPTSYRKGLFETLRALKSRYALHLVSGDNDAEKRRLLPFFDQLRFKQSPMDKLAYIKSIPQKSLMIGDGLNDAGALKQAHCGVAVAEHIHQFSPACDAIIQAQNLVKLPAILQFSREVKWVVYIAFGLSFLYNAIGLSFAMAGKLTPLISAILMPISSVTVVAFVTLSITSLGRKIR